LLSSARDESKQEGRKCGCGVTGNGDIRVVQPLAKRPALRRNHIPWQ